MAHFRWSSQYWFYSVIRSSSGDTYILGLVIATILAVIERVFYDGGNDLNQKGGWLNDLQPKNDLKEALTGFYAFTGNDFIPAFFWKSVGTRWLEIPNL